MKPKLQQKQTQFEREGFGMTLHCYCYNKYHYYTLNLKTEIINTSTIMIHYIENKNDQIHNQLINHNYVIACQARTINYNSR